MGSPHDIRQPGEGVPRGGGALGRLLRASKNMTSERGRGTVVGEKREKRDWVGRGGGREGEGRKQKGEEKGGESGGAKGEKARRGKGKATLTEGGEGNGIEQEKKN